jgi:hypothetical protein
MNERIRELAEQASKDSVDGYPVTLEYTKRFAEKFTELIVRECANIVSNKVTLETNEDYREGFQRAKQFIWQDINKHFGIE